MEFDPPVEEDLNSRRSRNLSLFLELAQPENDEPEPEPAAPKGMPDLRPEVWGKSHPDELSEDADGPPSIGPPKKRDRKKISSDEYSAGIAFLQEASFDSHTPC
jgi:hypothetical protein